MQTKRYDIVVLGGGIAGVAAAVQAARCGARAALVEKTIFPGGLATTGLVYLYLPLCDGCGHQILFGMAEELYQASMKYGPGQREEKRYMGIFSPASFILALDEILDDAGVDVWYDTLFCKSCVTAGRLEAVEVENKSGRLRLEAGCFVDATGDGDVAVSAGAPYTEGRNTPAIWEIHHADGALKNSRALSDGQERFCGNWKEYEYPGVSGRVVTDFVRDTRRRLRAFYQEKYAKDPALKHKFFSMLLPSMATFRRTRAVTGLAAMCDANEDAVFEDSVALINEWRRPGPVREVPFGALIPKGVRGLLTAGRCISSVEESWEWTRVIPAAAVTGQIAGFAADMAVRGSVSPEEIDVKELQKKLLAEKFYLHRPDFCAAVPPRQAETADAGHVR
jgi:hypothetical protein